MVQTVGPHSEDTAVYNYTEQWLILLDGSSSTRPAKAEVRLHMIELTVEWGTQCCEPKEKEEEEDDGGQIVWRVVLKKLWTYLTVDFKMSTWIFCTWRVQPGNFVKHREVVRRGISLCIVTVMSAMQGQGMYVSALVPYLWMHYWCMCEYTSVSELVPYTCMLRH